MLRDMYKKEKTKVALKDSSLLEYGWHCRFCIQNDDAHGCSGFFLPETTVSLLYCCLTLNILTVTLPLLMAGPLHLKTA